MFQSLGYSIITMTAEKRRLYLKYFHKHKDQGDKMKTILNNFDTS